MMSWVGSVTVVYSSDNRCRSMNKETKIIEWFLYGRIMNERQRSLRDLTPPVVGFEPEPKELNNSCETEAGCSERAGEDRVIAPENNQRGFPLFTVC
jgi:hypothetical protein